jgi:tRNA dimethylallyltransferase
MLSSNHKPPLIVIVGPTAVGKTEIASQLAEWSKGEIVSADSRLFYRGMDIGTAKPTLAERTRVPHHLIDIAEPDQNWSLAMFQQAAYQAIEETHARGNLPFLVGGSGQYIRAVIDGWSIPGVEPNPDLRRSLESWSKQVGSEGLYSRLEQIDPEAAARIDPRNLRRTIRALEVILYTGERFSAQRRKGDAPYRHLILGLTRPRPELYARIDARIDAMLNAGLIEEVASLLALGYDPGLPSLSAIGYRQIVDYLQGEIGLEEAIIQMKRSTRRFVRRQANWFKPDDPQIKWFQVTDDILDQMSGIMKEFLTSKNQLTGDQH